MPFRLSVKNFFITASALHETGDCSGENPEPFVDLLIWLTMNKEARQRYCDDALVALLDWSKTHFRELSGEKVLLTLEEHEDGKFNYVTEYLAM